MLRTERQWFEYAVALSLLWCSEGMAQSAREQGGRVSDRMLFTGYGEMHYNNPSNDIAELDFHRLVFGFGYQFTDRISVMAELDFEHAFTEPELEYAYLDFFYRDAASFRAGLVMMPVGPLNEFHEPPLFYSVERPYVQRLVIPTTWQEPGVGSFGTLADGSVGYRAYVVGGLDASEFRDVDGIRSGRQRGAEAKAEDLAVVGRVEYSPRLDVSLGASGYFGGASQGDPSMGDAAVGIVEVDGLVKVGGFDLLGVFAATFINDADSISTNNSSGTVVGEEIVGWYGEVAYHLLKRMRERSKQDLVLFGRYERFDTHHGVPDGFTKDPGLDRRVVTLGASFLPIPQIALKADIELWEAGDGSEWEQVNAGLAFMY